jgi:hypothetical protein
MAGEAYTLPSEFNQVGEKESVENIEKAIEATDINRKLNIDSEIKFLCRPLNGEEYSLLEKDIEKHGCINPIIYWEGHDIIVDGHNRYEICNKIGKPYKCLPMAFETKDDVMNYVIDHQLGRRNLSGTEGSYLRGVRYQNEKRANHRPKTSELHQDDGVNGETAQRIAKKTGVSQATIERDGSLAEAIAKLRAEVDDDFSDKLLSEKVKLSKKGIIELSKKSTDDMKALAELIGKGKKLSEAEKIVQSQNASPSNPTADTTPKPKKDMNLDKIERHFKRVLETLDRMETTGEPDKLVQLSAVALKICDRLKEIGGKTSDPSGQIVVSATNNHQTEIKEDGISTELTDNGIEIDDDDSSNSLECLEDMPPGWDEYEDAIAGEIQEGV